MKLNKNYFYKIVNFFSFKTLKEKKYLLNINHSFIQRKNDFTKFVSKSILSKLEKFANNFDSHQSLEHQEILYKATPVWSKSLIWAITGSVGFGFIYACIARIDEVVIARGELQALGAERPIKALNSGVISLINIKEGQEVQEGQLLIQFDPEVSKNRVSTLTNEYFLESQRKIDQNQEYKARELSLNAKLESLEASSVLQSNIVSRYTSLVEQGGISVVEYLREKNRLQELLSQITQTKASLAELKSQSSSLKKSVQREISNIERQLMEAKKVGFNEQLRSPVKGKVFDLVPSSPGYIAVTGETLLKIVPHGDVEAKVFLTNSDIGFIRSQMKAQIRVDAYPFTQFGHISASLKAIGDEVLPADETSPQTRFPAYLKLDTQYLTRNGVKYKVRSGQSVSANLIVRDKPVISLLTDAIEKAWDALRGLKSSTSR